jgi:prevent-host-death family protein
METVGAYEAKTHLPRLLDRVAQGERITITKHGVPVAMLVPVSSLSKEERQVAIQELRTFRRGRKLGDESIRDMIEEGRRF